MDMKRKGYNRDSGYSIAFENKSARLSMDTTLGQVHCDITGADGMGPQGEYEYRITLGASDLCALLDFLAQQRTIIEEGALNTQLRTQSHNLLRLLIASSGLPLALQPTEEAIKLANLRAKIKGNANVKPT